MIIADGAAFGPEMGKILKLMKVKPQLNLYLPESFEWLILQSELYVDLEIKEILAAPYKYINSEECVSWERYFTQLLIDKTKDRYLSYSKKVLNPVYKQEMVAGKILKVMEKIEFSWNNFY